MIELHSTWNWVVMLLVAGLVGMLGGIGAAFIEWRQRCASPELHANVCSPRKNVISCIVLGGIAAVAILYFFPPTKVVIESAGEGEPEENTFYNLVELVALALIVGSAGAAFLQALQTRALALASAEKVKTAEATAKTAIQQVANQAAKATESGVADASGQLKVELSKSESVPTQQVEEIVEDLADAASSKVAKTLEQRVEEAQQMVAAAVSGNPPE
jgi:hypothetical protein